MSTTRTGRTELPGRAGRLAVLCAVLAACVGLVVASTSSATAEPGSPGHPAGPGRAARSWSVAPPSQQDFPALPARCQAGGDYYVPVQTCHITSYGKRRPIVVAWGDSHLWMYLPALTKAARSTRSNLVVLFAGGCPPVDPEPRTAERSWTGCESHDAQALSYVEHVATHGRDLRLILGAWWDGYRARYRAIKASPHPDKHWPFWSQRMAQIAHDDTASLFDLLGSYGVPTDVMAQPATVPAHPHACATGRQPYRCNLSRRAAIPKAIANEAWVKRQMAGLTSPARYIDPTPAYCTAKICRGVVDGRRVFYDDIHLGATFTATLSAYFLPSFRAAATG